MYHPEVIARLLLHTNPVTYARPLLVQVMVVEIAASQLSPKMAAMIHEQQLITINRCNAGYSFRWFAVRPLREPVVPA
jgi:hypothetical protein